MAIHPLYPQQLECRRHFLSKRTSGTCVWETIDLESEEEQFVVPRVHWSAIRMTSSRHIGKLTLPTGRCVQSVRWESVDAVAWISIQRTLKSVLCDTSDANDAELWTLVFFSHWRRSGWEQNAQRLFHTYCMDVKLFVIGSSWFRVNKCGDYLIRIRSPVFIVHCK